MFTYITENKCNNNCDKDEYGIAFEECNRYEDPNCAKKMQQILITKGSPNPMLQLGYHKYIKNLNPKPIYFYGYSSFIY